MKTNWQKGWSLSWKLCLITLISFHSFAQKSSGKKPDKTPSNDCSGNCFSTQVISAKVNADCCTEYELKISHDGTCRYDLSHVAFEVPCGTITNLSNSRNWTNVIGKDPTTGLNGFKIDNVPAFGKDSDSTFTIKVTICGDSLCQEKLGAVAYKAATCVDYDTLEYSIIGNCNPDGDNDGDGGNGDGGDTGGDGGGDNGGGTGTDTTTTCSTLLASIKVKGTTCYASADGSLTASIQDGKAPYTFRWSTGSTDSTIQNLSAGAYYVTITDGNNNTLTLNAVVTQPNEIIISETILNASCNGNANGSIDLSASGGNGMYNYLWSTGATTEDINLLKAGNYSVIVTDSAGCEKQKSFAIVNETRITLSASVTKAACGKANGAINLTPSGGATPYTFMWSNGAATEDLQNLAVGTYKATVTDAGGCQTQGSFVISENNTVRVSYTVTAAGCSNEAVGGIDITVTGGTSPYTYSWQSGQTTEDISGLVSGIYRVTVTDNAGCSVLTAINVPKKTIQASAKITQPLCYGDSTGSITVTPVDQTTTYTYSWSNGDTDNTLTDVPVGSYTVTITDASGCTRMLTYNITQPSAMVTSSVVSNTQCGAEGSYSIDLSVSGGSAPYTYVWSTGETLQDLQNITSGTYSVVITDANKCTSFYSVTVNSITVNWSCLIEVPTYNMICNSVGNILNASVTDANQYSWSVTSSDNSWIITSDPSASSIAFTAGNSNTTATFTLFITKDGCAKTCSYPVSTSCSIRDNNGGGDPNTGDPCSPDTVVTIADSTTVLPEPTPSTIEEQSTDASVSVYPNPFETTLNFEWVATADEIVRLEVLDALGRSLTEVFVGHVHKGERYKFDWTGAGLRDRMYFYRFTSGGKSKYGKMFRKQ